jgi:hypothetical protein
MGKREYGSFQNMAMANTPPAVPSVGDGATLLSWTDRFPATVVFVSPSGKTIHLQEDIAIRTDENGMSECQAYKFEPNKEATIQVARLTRKGWKIVKGSAVLVGHRSRYHDYSF